MPIIIPSNNSGKRHYDKVVWTTAEDDKLRERFSICKPTELVPLFGLTYEQIRTRARSLGLKSRKTLMRESLHQKFFSDLTVTSSYWAGFLLADGCVRGHKLWIGLSARDKDHLAKFAEQLGIPNSVRIYQSTAKGVVGNRPYLRAVLEVGSVSLVEDLKSNFNVQSRKNP